MRVATWNMGYWGNARQAEAPAVSRISPKVPHWGKVIGEGYQEPDL
jgi:hypothetical protein